VFVQNIEEEINWKGEIVVVKKGKRGNDQDKKHKEPFLDEPLKVELSAKMMTS